MAILKNMKVREKMIMGFGLLLLITVVLSAYGAWNIVQIDREYTYVLDKPVVRHQLIRDIEVSLMNMRSIGVYAAVYIGEEAHLLNIKNELNAVYDALTRQLNNLRHLIQSDVYSAAPREEQLFQIIELGRLISQYISQAAVPKMQFAYEGNLAGVLEKITEGADINALIYDRFKELASAAQEYTDGIIINLHEQITFVLIMLLAMTGISLILGITIAILISKSITAPIKEAAAALGEAAAGNLNIKLYTNRSDETGILIKRTQNLVETLQSFTDDINNMSDEHDKGETEVFIDSSKYMGVYNLAANKINYMVKSHINTKNQVFDVFAEMAEGNFDVQLERMPAKNAFLNEAADNMRKQIKGVGAEVEGMVQAAVNGEFSSKIDVGRYKGDWRKIMTGLNRVSEAVDKPLSEINEVMINLSMGEFDAKVNGDFKGDFLTIQESVNRTTDTLSDYINEVTKVLDAISSGDLTQCISREYAGNFAEIRRSINHITDTLHKIITDIASAASQVFDGAKQISESAISLANGATIQAGSIEELNASMDEIDRQTSYNAKDANNASNFANNSVLSAEEVNKSMEHMLEAMQKIKEASRSISKIIAKIQEIAFQTHLLSLNATVEAARAGEHGKGFNVVAAEVRNLAEKSQKSATETTDIIEDSIVRIEAGVTLAQTTADSLNTILSNAGEVLSIINNIAVASNEQSEAIKEVTIGLGQISEVVQNTSDISEGSAAASEELSAQAEVLQQLVEYFDL